MECNGARKTTREYMKKGNRKEENIDILHDRRDGKPAPYKKKEKE